MIFYRLSALLHWQGKPYQMNERRIEKYMGLLEMGYSDPNTDLHVEGVCVDFDRFLADLDWKVSLARLTINVRNFRQKPTMHTWKIF